MGSFDYNDDYSSFDNLLDRATVLTEGGRGLGVYHPGLGGTLTSRLKDAGSEAFTRDARLFAVHILFGASIITDEEESMLTQPGMPAGGKNYRLTLLQILDNHKDEIIERADEISDAIEERFPAFANDILGRDPERIKNNISKREVKLANDEIQRGIKSGEDPVDVITDGIEKVLANAAVLTTLTNAQGKVDDKDLDTVKKYATQFVNGFNDVDILIKKLKTFDTESFNVLADELSNSLSNAKGNAGIGEDDEEAPYRSMYEPGGGDAYSENESEAQSTEVEDEEVISREGLNSNMRKRKLLFEKKKNWNRFRSEDEETKEEKKEARDRKRPGGSNAGDYPNVDKSDFCGPAGGAPEGTYPVNSEKRARAALSYAHNAPDPEGLKRCVYRKAKEHGWFDESEDEEEYRHSPMLDSHQTNTSGYITEQAAKDKRNKKSKVKNESFKERFKPKTHWQLQELRRRGL